MIYSACFVALALRTAISLAAAPVDRWHERGPLPEAPHFSEIAYGNGLFVAVGSAATDLVLATSRDGRIWSVQRRANINLATITFGNGVFVALDGGVNSPYRGLASRDGVNWTEISLASANGPYFRVHDVAFGSQGFIVVASYLVVWFISPWEQLTGTLGYVGSSSNGYAWSYASGGPILQAITYGRGAFVAIDTGGFLRVSTNGPWTAPFAIPPTFISVAFEGDKFLAGAVNNQSSTNRACLVYISTNAINWTSHAISNCLRDVSFGEGIYAAVDDATISTSPDGIVWTSKYQHPSARFTSIAYGAGTFVAVGDRGTIVQSDPFAPILALRAAGTNLQLEVFAEPGNYELHSSPNLETWHNAGPFTNEGSNTVFDLQPTGSQRFYRARRLP